MKRKLLRIAISVFVPGLVLFGGGLWLASNQLLINFIHSKEDNRVPYEQTQKLADEYVGPKRVWFADKGGHAATRDVDRADYEKRLVDFLNSVR